MKSKRAAESNPIRRPGRPVTERPSHPLAVATREHLAELLGLSVVTLWRWRTDHQESPIPLPPEGPPYRLAQWWAWAAVVTLQGDSVSGLRSLEEVIARGFLKTGGETLRQRWALIYALDEAQGYVFQLLNFLIEVPKDGQCSTLLTILFNDMLEINLLRKAGMVQASILTPGAAEAFRDIDPEFAAKVIGAK